MQLVDIQRRKLALDGHFQVIHVYGGMIIAEQATASLLSAPEGFAELENLCRWTFRFRGPYWLAGVTTAENVVGTSAGADDAVWPNMILIAVKAHLLNVKFDPHSHRGELTSWRQWVILHDPPPMTSHLPADLDDPNAAEQSFGRLCRLVSHLRTTTRSIVCQAWASCTQSQITLEGETFAVDRSLSGIQERRDCSSRHGSHGPCSLCRQMTGSNRRTT